MSMEEARRAAEESARNSAPARSFASAFSAAALAQNLAHNLAQAGRALIRAPRAQLPPVRPAAILAVVIVLVVVVALMFFADAAAIGWARRLPPAITGQFEAITDFGLAGWFLFPFGFIVLAIAAITSPALSRLAQGALAVLAARFGFLFLAIAAPGLFVTVVKRLIGRGRPTIGAQDNPFVYLPFHWQPDYASLPSGHATNAAAAAVAIGALWPRARPLMWLYAAIIMASRVVVLAHHPSDVVAGALVGVIGALLVRRWFAARRLVFSPRDLKALPPPSRARLRAALHASVAGSH
jgi:membrane-associated phospholipid phosphatase